jgi:hypothetical protein
MLLATEPTDIAIVVAGGPPQPDHTQLANAPRPTVAAPISALPDRAVMNPPG